MGEPLCRIQDLQKQFGQNRVLRGLSLSLPEGQVTALMGANGAGKSTLVKILSGVHRRSGGAITLLGRPFDPAGPADAIRQGIVTVHQSINEGVIPDLDVASNLLLDRLAEPRWGMWLNKRRLYDEARRIAERISLDVDVRRPVAELDVADRQLIAIARAMAQEPKLLILDEPTSSLSASEAERLFSLVDRLRREGVAILYISHRMSDIRRIADRIVSMRDGEIAGVFEGTPLDYEGAVNAMLGHRMTEVDIDIPEPGPAVLEAKDLRLREEAKPFDLTLRDNEVVAVTGLLGSGKTALAETLFGLRPPFGGGIWLDGAPYRVNSAAEAIAAGVFLSPKDRASNAIVPDFDLTRNISLPFLCDFSTLSVVSRGQEAATARDLIDALGIVCQSETDAIGTLSGGNQQKVMLARWLARDCRLLILDEPFQGVDIRSRRDIGRKVRQTARGRATVVIASEIDEVLEVADRIVVMHEHAITDAFVNRDIDLNALLVAVAGSAANERTAA